MGVLRVALLLTFAGCRTNDATAPSVNGAADPSVAVIETGDLARFWRAWDAGGRDGSSEAFQRRYLDSASAGLRGFMAARGITATTLAAMARQAPRYLTAIRPLTERLSPTDPVFAEIRRNYGRARALYPDATFPPLTLAFGRYSTAGTTSSAGMVIGMEFYGADVSPPLDELNDFARLNLFSVANLPVLVAHEHAHILQQGAGAFGTASGTLLARALIEGGAEFMAELVTGRPSYAARFLAWQANEATYWREFQREMNGTDISRWLYNYGSASATWPADLGYFVGYRIAQGFYDRASDKARAVRELMMLRDPAAVLAASGYTGQGPTLRF